MSIKPLFYALNCSLLCLSLYSCQPQTSTKATQPLFTALPPARTGIDFTNQLFYTEEYNAYTYRNFYNGGGVGVGDINNDGLPDLYFCGNLADNQLYLNQGDFRFEDITEQAGVACHDVWSSGVSFADVNGDGWLDIYICKSGDPSGAHRYNELFINNGDLTFTERAAEYGIDDLGLSTHAAFFDYDLDGDLDLYLLNNSIRNVGGYDLRPGQREIRDTLGGNKLYRNDLIPPENGASGFFIDVSEEAGIYGSMIGFGLGVAVSDLNRDGWPDFFVSNDFFERDYLYLNNQDGTFSEVLEAAVPETSLSSMGADIADLNNDTYPEIFVTDMLPADDARMKTKTTFENWDKYQLNVKNGYHHQFTRNVLQFNNGDGTFSEIGRLAGVHATDWSWGALIGDLDNDGWKDLFVANGIYKDLTDQDYINFYSDPASIRAMIDREQDVIKALLDGIPSVPLPNYAFRNEGPRDASGIPTFTNATETWGLQTPSFSNGSAYGDLDNDGDLDLVMNNVNMPAFVYRNSASQDSSQHFLQIQLQGYAKNTFGLGSQVTLRAAGQTYYQELQPMRGFQSCVDHRLHFGLGATAMIDTLEVRWPDGRLTQQFNLPANQHLTLSYADASAASTDADRKVRIPLLETIDPPPGGAFIHQENDFIDFDRDQLLLQMYSRSGPCLAVADVNQDGLDDVFMGGAKEQPGTLLLQQANGSFTSSNQAVLAADQIAEDVDAIFFDADGDSDPDLYVASGGNEFSSASSGLKDRLYLNDGRGNFSKAPRALPSPGFHSTGCVAAGDYDGDGDLDLFVGTRLRPFVYGVPVDGFLLENDGNGQFTDVTEAQAPELLQLGMMTDARWLDFDADQDLDLVVIGDWMTITVFENTGAASGARLVNVTERVGLAQSNGFWNCLEIADLDADGDLDLILGNHGSNTRLQASSERPVRMYVSDFDGNRSTEQVVTVYNGEAAYPLVLRHDLIKQLPSLKKKYLKYENYKEQRIEDVFSPEQLAQAIKLQVFHTQSSIALNQGNGRFLLQALPAAAQLAPVYGILVTDFNQDGNQDIMLGGNLLQAKPEVGSYNASYGTVLLGDGTGHFQPLKNSAAGFSLPGAVRDVALLQVAEQPTVLVSRNDDSAIWLRILMGNHQ